MSIFKNIQKKQYLNTVFSDFLERFTTLQKDFDLSERISNWILQILVYTKGTLEDLLFKKNIFPTIVNNIDKITRENIKQAFKTLVIFYIGNLLYLQPRFFSKKEIAQMENELQEEENPDSRAIEEGLIQKFKPLSKKEISQTEKCIAKMFEFSSEDEKFLKEIKKYSQKHKKPDIAFYHQLFDRLLFELFGEKVTSDPAEILVFAQLLSVLRLRV